MMAEWYVRLEALLISIRKISVMCYVFQINLLLTLGGLANLMNTVLCLVV